MDMPWETVKGDLLNNREIKKKKFKERQKVVLLVGFKEGLALGASLGLLDGLPEGLSSNNRYKNKSNEDKRGDEVIRSH